MGSNVNQESVAYLLQDKSRKEGSGAAATMLANFLCCIEFSQEELGAAIWKCTDPYGDMRKPAEPKYATEEERLTFWQNFLDLLEKDHLGFSDYELLRRNLGKAAKIFEETIQQQYSNAKELKKIEQFLKVAISLRNMLGNIGEGAGNSLLRACGYNLGVDDKTRLEIYRLLQSWQSEKQHVEFRRFQQVIDEIIIGMIRRSGVYRVWYYYLESQKTAVAEDAI